MVSTGAGWWRRHGLTVALLLSAFGIAVLVRTVFMAQIIELWGPLNVYGGGSDSFYHSRVMEYIILNHANLGRDLSLNYPIGAVNPREPLFDWMNAILGILFAPLFGGSAVQAGSWFLDMGGPIWAGLGVFPVYLIGREVSSRRVGIVGAFTYPLLVANIDSSTLGYANYLAFYTFFILLTIYGYLRTLKAVGSHRWVTSYRSPRAILTGLRDFLRVERAAVRWAVFTGVCFGTLALAWQGYTYFVAIVVIFVAFALVVERIRKIDSFGLYVATWIVGLVGFPMAMPYYIPQGLFAGWFDLPLLLYFGALLVVLPFLFLRDSPWVVSLPVLVGVAGVAIGVLDLVNHTFFLDIVTGQGYFVKTLVYSTVAEAQAPSIDQLILGYGVVTFFLAFVGLALYAWSTVRSRFRRVQMLFLVFAIMSIYLPVSAAKFFFLGSAAFALLPAEAIVRFLDVGGYGELRRTASSLADRHSRFSAFRRAFKARHVLVMALVVVIVLPNVWYAVDAGVPYNEKSQYNLQIYNTLPAPLRTSPQNSSQFYLGAAGTQLDTPDQYDEDGYNWLSQQDQNLPEPQRPAFVSWWDYGFQAVAQGQHPTVADNFQNGIDPAGNFLLAQNESQGIAVLTTRLLTAEMTETGLPYLPAGLNRVLAADGVNLTELHTLLVNTSQDIPLVLGHPDRYLPVDTSHLDGTNAMYMAVAYFLATSLPETGVAQVYNDVQAYTGWSIRYAMVDSRLFPTSGYSTGIFYAPADLTDRIISSGGLPTTYFSVTVIGSDGNSYPLGQVPPGVLATNYQINYYAPFYDSMIYHIFAGYNGSDVGQSAGIPGLSGGVQSDPVMPGWMLQHFQVVYRTAYYCPYADPTQHPGCYRAMNAVLAQKLAKLENGTANSDPAAYYGANGGGGETILEYYPGQTMTGAIQLPDGTPVPNARVTVYDDWGIPHMTTVTGSNGVYSVILPPGNDTVNVTTGVLNQLNQADSTTLLSLHVQVPDSVGFNAHAPVMVRPVVLTPSTVQGFLYWNAANNSSYLPHLDPIVPGATVSIFGAGAHSYNATTDASGAFVLANVAPGVYNLTVSYQGSRFPEAQVYLGAGQTHNATTGLNPGGVAGKVFLPTGGFGAPNALVTVSGPNGVVGTATTNQTGTFRFSNLGPGNYSVVATLASQGLGTPATAVTIHAAGVRVVQNLTLAPVTSIYLVVLDAGTPVPAFPVRFTPITPLLPPTGNGSAPRNGSAPSPGPPSPTSSPSANSTLLYTDANGVISATLPYGNYSIYGLGVTANGLSTGFASAYLPAGTSFVPLAPLSVEPAVALSGTTTASGSSTVVTHVYAFTARGDEVSTDANASGHFVLYLPQGTYSLLALQVPTSTTGGAPPLIGTANVTLTYPTDIPLPLGPSTTLHARVGAITITNGGGFFPASGAVVRESETGGWQATFVADAQGNVTLAVPSIVPGGTTFCLSASAVGFTPNSMCGLTPTLFGEQAIVHLALAPVAVGLDVLGLPAGTGLTVNFTAVSATAVSKSVAGGPTFQLTLTPGDYALSGWAPAGNGTGGLFRAPTSLNESIPLGAQQFNVTLVIFHEVSSHGALALPPGLTNASVQVHLLSAATNLTVGGAAFERAFLAPPGTYTVYASGTINNGSSTSETGAATYASVSTVTVNATGAVTPAVPLLSRAAHLTGNLTLPDGSVLNASVTFTLTSAGTLSLPTTANRGFYSSVLPSNVSFVPSVTTTQLLTVGGVARYETLTAAPGTTCTPVYPATRCDIPLVSTPVLTNLTGTLTVPGYPGTLDGTVTLVGPLPETGTVVYPTTGGEFTARLVPGSYQLYATAGGASSPLANLSVVTVGPSVPSSVTVRLTPTWTDTLTLLPPTGGAVGAATVEVNGPGGVALTLTGVAVGSAFSLPLPAGVYTVHASAPGSAYGVPVNATATVLVPLLAGNAATTLPLAYALHATVSVSILAPSSVTVGDGGTATFTFVARNAGNEPAAVHFVGSPSTWTFVFHPANATLGVASANESTSGWVAVTVPHGTLATPPEAQVQAFFANGTLAGPGGGMNVSVVPTVSFLAGPDSTGTSLSPTSGTVGFYLYNTGNVPELLTVSVQNAIDLEALGWTVSVEKGTSPIPIPLDLAPASNQTFGVKLSGSGPVVYPGTIDLVVTATNGSLSSTTGVVLTVPRLTVSLNSTGIVVTGPNLGSPSPYPDWLVPLLAFLPAIALVAGLVGYRWWRTRRWTRR